MKNHQEEFQKATNVSRETIQSLEYFEELLLKWNPSINLVSKSTLPQIWQRHFLDSAQLAKFFPEVTCKWVDMGSGGGFPAVILAIMAKGVLPNVTFTMIESDQRKAAFLLTAIRDLDLKANVVIERVEKTPEQNADVLSARALAPLTKLLGFAKQHLNPAGIAIFSKGETFRDEIKQAREHWSFDIEEHKSKTNHNSVILKIGAISRA